MWVVFRKSDGKMIGTSAHGRVELPKEKAIQQSVRGLGGDEVPEDFDAIQVRDPEQVRALRSPENSGHVTITKSAEGALEPVIQRPETFLLQLLTDIKERHPVDGVATISADGKSMAEISIQKIDEQRRPVARAEDNDELWLRTDHGTLFDIQGNPVRNLNLSRGEAAFRLQSETARRLATVLVFSSNSSLEDATIAIEFV